ncbi:GDSL esterase/lipase At5g03610-like [Ziziphus jujuba]|uniref:GDSL esterase/lipase At5g03610-like n=1 Tax=Ziziphus jujuba TaxID=326968 RepID=A0A6P4B068_ZIZJJ|nr:GDSL esterase/lipase At5g03610-like [Ziziphus jujuba]
MNYCHIQKLFLCFFLLMFLFSSGQQGGVKASSAHHRHGSSPVYSFRPTKLFVLGDSYSDTGNRRKSELNSWKYPFGITFPGKPTGRFSDGRVLTDYIAKFVGLRSPLPYQWRKVGASAKLVKYGMNLAHGGTGVFNTVFLGPNMTIQIDFLERLTNKYSVYTTRDLQSSIALVTVAGNDYLTYISRNGSAQGFPSLISSVVNQLTSNLKRIHKLGVKKIALTAIEPFGCLPWFTTKTSFKHCNETLNKLISLHNDLLHQAVAKLNNETHDSPFTILDLYASFTTVFKNKGDPLRGIKFENPLKPCCVGISSAYSCASVDQNGVKKYTLCDDRQSTFFWDAVHPSQEGWRSVFSALQPTLEQIFYA